MNKGTNLFTPENRDIRPTSERAREAIFNILGHNNFGVEINNSVVLDCFCGSGALGLEALSRGAKKAYFIDNNKVSIDLAQKNIILLKQTVNARTILADVNNLPVAEQTCNLVFLDPPYRQNLIPLAINELKNKNWIDKFSLIIVEIAKKDILPESLVVIKERTYGKALICITKIKE